jgi:uncharacterized protein YjbI with pentapeptide repeats
MAPSLRYPTGAVVQEIYSKDGRLILTVKEIDSFDGMDLGNADFAGVSVSACCCQGANFTGADLRNADLYWAIGHDANFANADLSGATLCGANFSGASFAGANLTRADFGCDNLNGSTTLKGTDLRSDTLRYATLSGAIFDESTVFPDGFDPRAHGMLARDE